jgi:hypothetical protein
MEDGISWPSITIRFASSVPDLPLTYQSPYQITPQLIRQQIRAQRSQETSSRRLRLIHAGKVLVENENLGDVLRLPVPRPVDEAIDPKGKGKARSPFAPAVWIHCSIGDILTPQELLLETSSTVKDGSGVTSRSTTPLTTPAPIGFDRLLNASFTPSEISALRAQFISLLAQTHTPDTMPSVSELRLLEERWLNEGAAPGGGGGGVDGLTGEGSGLDDMFWGNLIGFFWPLGAGLWLIREENWSRRRKMAVLTGLGMNIMFSAMRFAS